MILEQFDSNKKAIINAEDVVKQKIENFPKVTISCFSHQLYKEILDMFPHEKICEIHTAIEIQNVYKVKYKDTEFALFHAYVGEPSLCSVYEDLIAFGSQKLILFGTCGVLDKEIKDCSIIIPTRAIRDEGTSYHYKEASDYIDVNHKYIDDFTALLEEFGYHYTIGTTWTTDAPYRETKDKMLRRKEQGAICVEMECAGMQALCDFRESDFFEFFYAADNLDNNKWDPRSLSGEDKVDEKVKIALLAFEFGLKIRDK